MSIFAATATKIAALGMPAKATALGFAVALGATGGVVAHAADAEHAPEEVTDVGDERSTVDEDAADGNRGDLSDGAPDDVKQPADDADDVADDGSGEPDDGSGIPPAASFGQSVAADARDGGVDGREISRRAHERNELRRQIADEARASRERDRDRDRVHAPVPAPVPAPVDVPAAEQDRQQVREQVRQQVRRQDQPGGRQVAGTTGTGRP